MTYSRRTVWLLLVIGAISAGMLAAMAWFVSDADIREVEALARSQGILASEDPMPASRFSESQLHLQKLVDFSSQHAAAIDERSAIPPAAWAQIDAIIDALPPRPIPMPAAPYGDEPPWTLTVPQRLDLLGKLGGRLRRVDIEDLPETARRFTRFCTLAEPSGVKRFQNDLACVMIFTEVIASRIPELRDHSQAVLIARYADDLRARLWVCRVDAWRNETLKALSLARGPLPLPISSASAAFSYWHSISRWLKIQGCRVVYRWNRKADLEYVTQRTRLAISAPGMAEYFRSASAWPFPVPGLGRLAEFSEADPVPFSSEADVNPADLVKTLLSLEALSAVLTNRSAPADPFAANSAPLMPFTCGEGRTGWYSVGPDGQDDGNAAGKDFSVLKWKSAADR